MDLKNYLSAKRGRMSWLCREIGAYPSDMSRWADGKRPVPAHFARKIDAVTKGEVSRIDLCPDDWEKIWPELARQPKKAKAAI